MVGHLVGRVAGGYEKNLIQAKLARLRAGKQRRRQHAALQRNRETDVRPRPGLAQTVVKLIGGVPRRIPRQQGFQLLAEFALPLRQKTHRLLGQPVSDTLVKQRLLALGNDLLVTQ